MTNATGTAHVANIARLDRQDTDAFPAINSGAQCPVWCTRHRSGNTETAPDGRTILTGNLHEATIADVSGTKAETNDEPAKARVMVERFDDTGETPEVGPVRLVLEVADRDPVGEYDMAELLRGYSAQSIRTIAAAAIAGVESQDKAIALEPAEALRLAAGLVDSARLLLGEPTMTEALSGLLDAAFRLGRASDRDQVESVAKIEAEINSGPGGDPWFLADRIADGQPMLVAEQAHWTAVNALVAQQQVTR